MKFSKFVEKFTATKSFEPRINCGNSKFSCNYKWRAISRSRHWAKCRVVYLFVRRSQNIEVYSYCTNPKWKINLHRGNRTLMHQIASTFDLLVEMQEDYCEQKFLVKWLLTRVCVCVYIIDLPWHAVVWYIYAPRAFMRGSVRIVGIIVV